MNKNFFKKSKLMFFLNLILIFTSEEHTMNVVKRVNKGTNTDDFMFLKSKKDKDINESDRLNSNNLGSPYEYIKLNHKNQNFRDIEVNSTREKNIIVNKNFNNENNDPIRNKDVSILNDTCISAETIPKFLDKSTQTDDTASNFDE